jgi:hypothetical protein
MGALTSRRWPLLLIAICILPLSGCVRETTEGSSLVFQNELWASALALVGGIVASIAGWFIRERSSRFGWTLLIGGPIVAIGLAPSLFLDRATVDQNGLSLRVGLWGMSAVHDVKYDDLSQVRLVMEESRGRRGRTNINYYLMCENKDGTFSKVPLGSKVAEAAAPHFLKEVALRDIAIVDET